MISNTLAQVVESGASLSSRNYRETKAGFTVGLCINSIGQFLPWEVGSSSDSEEIPHFFFLIPRSRTAFTSFHHLSLLQGRCAQATISLTMLSVPLKPCKSHKTLFAGIILERGSLFFLSSTLKHSVPSVIISSYHDAVETFAAVTGCRVRCRLCISSTCRRRYYLKDLPFWMITRIIHRFPTLRLNLFSMVIDFNIYHQIAAHPFVTTEIGLCVTSETGLVFVVTEYQWNSS